MFSLPSINPSQETTQISDFILKTFKHADKHVAVVAVSGGLDSATVLALTAQALQPENVIALHLPTKTTRLLHTQHAALSMDQAKIPPQNRLTINLAAMIQKSWRIINRLPNSKDITNTVQLNRLRIANLTARLRMLVLFDQAKQHRALVVGTENLSEHLLGYFTRFGDEASDLEPIRHLYKTQVIALAQFLDIPAPIIAKAPSADLWTNQTDELELGFAYAQADPILYLLNQGKTAAEIVAAGYPQKLTHDILKIVSVNAFKHQVPYLISPTDPLHR